MTWVYAPSKTPFPNVGVETNNHTHYKLLREDAPSAVDRDLSYKTKYIKMGRWYHQHRSPLKLPNRVTRRALSYQRKGKQRAIHIILAGKQVILIGFTDSGGPAEGAYHHLRRDRTICEARL
ncbi:hypothetical protein PENCOP_c004G06864 [Penicillium coprophilum]|uniref:Uncharacterized protein n=1 Tax=Penicillium coprophilum TaxID=36646 RepID=A0A1V6UV85_9EURO|nr:hypothetical protein PENCOP_c004G06864 [Penicillium coprophilum]